MKVLFACAGTGGHINPAIAIANIILKNKKDTEILFVGTKDGLENSLVKNAGFDIKHIRTGKIIRSLTPKNFKALHNAYLGISDAKEIIKEFKPDVVIGTGGYICVPVMLAAKKLKVPYILHESNAFPGVSVKLLAKKASRVMIGFEDARKRLKNRKNIAYTGTPAKFNEEDIDNLDREDSKEKLNLSVRNIGTYKDMERKIIFVTGGSQGARKLNQVVLDMVSVKRDEKMFFVLVTGNKNYDLVVTEKEKIEMENNIDLSKYIKIEKFVYDMQDMYNAADICITRSGAMTITELALAKKASVLIPYPYAAENHQYYNAKVLEDIDAAKIIEEDKLSIESLYNTLNDIIDNNKIEKMGQNAKKAQKKDVEKNIYLNIMDSI